MKNKLAIPVIIAIVSISVILTVISYYNISDESRHMMPKEDTLMWEMNSMDVKFTVTPEISKQGDTVFVGVEFLESGKTKTQVHVDYNLFITHEFDGVIRESTHHTSSGILKIPIDDVAKGVYIVTIEMTGKLFVPIDSEKAFTYVIVE